MLNVLDDVKVAAFVEAGLTHREDMVVYCLQQLESPRVTKHKAITALQKFLNTTFFSPLGIRDAQKNGEVRE